MTGWVRTSKWNAPGQSLCDICRGNGEYFRGFYFLSVCGKIKKQSMQEYARLNDDKTKMPSVCIGRVKIAWQNDI